MGDKCVALLQHLKASGVVSDNQTTLGFRRMLRALPDATVDNPHARSTFDYLVAKAVEGGVLPVRWTAAMTSVAVAREEGHGSSSSATGQASSGSSSSTSTGTTPIEPARPTHAEASPMPLGV